MGVLFCSKEKAIVSPKVLFFNSVQSIACPFVEVFAAVSSSICINYLIRRSESIHSIHPFTLHFQKAIGWKKNCMCRLRYAKTKGIKEHETRDEQHRCSRVATKETMVPQERFHHTLSFSTLSVSHQLGIKLSFPLPRQAVHQLHHFVIVRLLQILSRFVDRQHDTA